MIAQVYAWLTIFCILFFYQAEEMIAEIKDAFKTNLPQVKWMDKETKTKALNKVQLFFSPWSPQIMHELRILNIRATSYRIDLF